MLIIAIISLTMALGFWFIWIYNQMVKRRNHVEDGWSGIDVQLKRRHNLIPNIVEAVKEYTAHEKEIMQTIAELRRMAKKSQDSNTGNTSKNEQLIGESLKSIMIMIEAYPDLKANQNFINLQNELSEIEDKIQLSRRYYNGAVRMYNTLIQSFPALFISHRFGFIEAEYFELEDDDIARKTPKVDFK